MALYTSKFGAHQRGNRLAHTAKDPKRRELSAGHVRTTEQHVVAALLDQIPHSTFEERTKRMSDGIRLIGSAHLYPYLCQRSPYSSLHIVTRHCGLHQARKFRMHVDTKLP